MNAHRRPPDDPAEWLSRARSNLLQAQARQSGVYLEDLCFNAQQAAEKAIKAVLIRMEVEFPYSHDLAELLTLVQQKGLELPSGIEQAARLTRYAVATRYPGLSGPVSEEDHSRAVAIAQDVLGWAEQFVRQDKI